MKAASFSKSWRSFYLQMFIGCKLDIVSEDHESEFDLPETSS